MFVSPFKLRSTRRVLRAGGVIAYPTEAVYGLGCDPLNREAVFRLLALKRRPLAKGLILIASSFEQLAPYLQPLSPELSRKTRESWPGPVTWLLPARPETPRWLTGIHTTLAVRVTDHPVAAALCETFGGAIVSTSANPSDRPPARTPLTVRRMFGAGVDLIVHGALGGLERPTEIRDAATGRVVRL